MAGGIGGGIDSVMDSGTGGGVDCRLGGCIGGGRAGSIGGGGKVMAGGIIFVVIVRETGGAPSVGGNGARGISPITGGP